MPTKLIILSVTLPRDRAFFDLGENNWSVIPLFFLNFAYTIRTIVLSNDLNDELQMNRFLRISRIVISLAALAAATSGLACYGMWWGFLAAWMEKIQLIPAALAFSLTIFVGWLAVTLVFGRIYCSTVCPLGTLQDTVARLVRLGRYNPRRDYHYSPPLNRLRYICLIVVLACLMGGWLPYLSDLLRPWPTFRRIAVDCIRPLWGEGVNAASELGHMTGLWDFPPVTIGMATAIGTIVAAVTLALICGVAAKNGRTICNTLCPAGTTLGLISRFAIFQIDIDTDKCIQCRKCEHVCKASCIDLTDHVVDGSRCVDCFDCINVCPNDAIHYTARRKQLSIPMMQRLNDRRAAAPTACAKVLQTPCAHSADTASDKPTTIKKQCKSISTFSEK